MLLFRLLTNRYLAVLLVISIAMTINAPQGVIIALGQKFVGTSSGIMLGLAVSINDMLASAVGWVGDRYGLFSAMSVIAGLTCRTLSSDKAEPQKE